MSEFLKLGNQIFPRPEGIDYELVGGKVYNISFNDRIDEVYLEEDGELNLNFKVYSTDEEKLFMDRVVHHFETTDKNSTGVMLTGTKGTGKTVMAKLIAKQSKLPILIMSPRTPTWVLTKFFSQVKTSICIIFDEIDKENNRWRKEDLLGFLDGVQLTAKKLVIMTCNNTNESDEYLQDRCSRIRYVKTFESNSNERFLKELIKDQGITDTDDKLYTFMVEKFNVLSIDNILSFIKEVLDYPDVDYGILVKDMNISLKE